MAPSQRSERIAVLPSDSKAEERIGAGSSHFYAILHAIMRTTLDIDDNLMLSLLARHPGVSKKEAVEQAIRSYLEHDSVARIRALAGTIEIEDASAELRRVDRHT